MKKPIFPLIVIFIIIICPFSYGNIQDTEIFKINNNTNIFEEDEWADGKFNGKCETRQGDLIGYVEGNINLGRTSEIGTFNGKFNSTDNNGFYSGIIIKNLIIGKFHTKSGYFYGSIIHNNTDFTLKGFSKQIGIFYVYGKHEESFMPPLTGIYDIGVEKHHLIDENRYEEFTRENLNDYREFMIQIWYPTEQETSGDRIDYMGLETFNWLWGRSPVPLITISEDAYKHVMPHAKYGVSIAENSKPYPLIIFSPGYDGVYEIYTSLIEDLVSHGFIVASINHPYVSGITVFPDGRTIEIATPPDDPEEAKTFMNMSLRTVIEDAKFVLDYLTEINSTNTNWKGIIDLTKVGMYGHSFGGASTAVCCYEDNRFKAGLTLDGFFNEYFINDQIDKPFLMMIAENRINDSNTEYMWHHIQNDTYLVGVLGSTHYGYTDVGLLLSHYVPLIPIEILNFGTISPKKLINITRTYETTFFEVYLKNHPKEELLEIDSLFEEVIFEYK